jgi:hypothetical protein
MSEQQQMSEEQTEQLVEAEYEGQKAIAIQEMLEEEKARQAPPQTPAPEESDVPTERPYALPKGVFFLYEGKVGEMYVIPECNKVVKILGVGWGTIDVAYPATGSTTGISPNTEVIPYDPAKHAELVKKVARPKAEKEED